MTDERFDISRRKALAALGTIGVASAGVGLGTSAYFSDQETFENNQLVAGTLDVGVGYSAHYSDWSSDEGDGVGDVNMYDGGPNETGGADELTDDYTGLPANDAWLIEVPSGDVDTFLDNTQYQSFNQENGDLMECPLDEDEQADAEERPVIDLDDVKPGDFGEVTFDFRICDNPGFVWLNGEVESASENGLTEPEADDPQEDGDADSTDPADVELLDVVQTAVWVDDGNNYQNDGEEPSVQSLRELLSSLSMGTGVPVAGNTAPEDGGGSADARNCFAGDEFHSIAFAWWVPIDHGNEIQSDSASFSLGLYTEQCRHNDGEGMAPEDVTIRSDATGGVRETDSWITATISPGSTTRISVELDGSVYGDEADEWPSNSSSRTMEAVVDHDFDGLAGSDSNGYPDDFRIGYGGADNSARNAAGYNTAGGYIKRRQPDGSFTYAAEEDLSGFSATESGDQLSYTLEIDWTSDLSPTGSDVGVPSEMIVREVFGSDGGEGVAATPNDSNDGRGDVDNTIESSGIIQL